MMVKGDDRMITTHTPGKEGNHYYSGRDFFRKMKLTE